MKRRAVLRSMGALAGAAAIPRMLSGCRESKGAGDITTIVLVMMENRSYDHMLGARSWLHGLPGDGLADVLSNPDATGAKVGPFEPRPWELRCADPPHSAEATSLQSNDGAMDGFVTTHQHYFPGNVTPMQYLTRTHQPVSWALADAYATCDRWFSSVPGPTWPNRFYWLAGQSLGLRTNELPREGFTVDTIFHRLDEAEVPWKLYYGDVPFISLFGPEFRVDLTDRVRGIEDFFRDAAAGALPNVVYIDPPFYTGHDDHPPNHPMLGQEFIASIYNALATSPQWNNCLLLVTYDEHGGFFDHVPPARAVDDHAGFDRLGIRVPALVIGPYVKEGHVSSVIRDHTSALKHIETMFGTAPLTARSSWAPDLWELIDEERLFAGDARRPIELPALAVTALDLRAARTSEKRLQHDIVRVAEEHPEWTAKWNRRDELPAIVHAIRSRAASRLAMLEQGQGIL